MRVVVTGSEGYIGSVLCPYLVERGHDVVGVDAGFYRSPLLYEEPSTLRWRRGARTSAGSRARGPGGRRRDRAHGRALQRPRRPARAGRHLRDQPPRLRSISPRRRRLPAFRGSSTRRRAASTAPSDQELVDEESPLSPQTAYAECKELVERDVALMADDAFSPTFLRNATACGASPRIRFDVVLNNLCGPRVDDEGHPDGERRLARGARSSTCSTSARRSRARSTRRASGSTTRC